MEQQIAFPQIKKYLIGILKDYSKKFVFMKEN